MGRLFWKIFLACWLALAVAVAGTIAVILWAVHHEHEFLATQRAAERAARGITGVDIAESKLREGGVDTLRDWMLKMDRQRSGIPLSALDSAGKDVRGREVSDLLQSCVRAFTAPRQEWDIARVVAAPSGERYLLITDAVEKKIPPALLILLGTVTSLAVSALLARYLSRPIRNLRWAFDAAAEGRLETRVLPKMGQRRDAIADLGRDFDRMAQRLQALMSAQQRLLHDVSHELRSPLARLQVAIGLARQSPAKLDTSLDRIEREATRLDNILGDTLTLARLEAEAGSPAAESVDLPHVVASVVEDARFEAQAAHRSVSLQLSDDLYVMGNADLLSRAVENVVRNAVKYTAEGSTVEITLGRIENPPRAVLTVSDRGPGILPGDLEKIFKPFFRSTSAARTNGFGLGLAIAQKAIEQHGGRIVAINRDGGGLRVDIELPLDAPR